MLTDYYYKVAGFTFAVSLPEDKDIHRLLPSFELFYKGLDEPHGGEDLLFHFTACSAPIVEEEAVRILEESENDMGRVRLSETVKGYAVEVSCRNDAPVHKMCADRTFRNARACMRWDDPCAGDALNSLLRIIYSLTVLFRGGVSIHASSVALDGKAYIFMGRSGTGKSTHAALWQRCFHGCELLNDDNPTLRMENGVIMVYGTPWSGKTPCYRNTSYPLAGAVRLRQSKENRFVSRTEVDAFTVLLPGCSAIRGDREMCGSLYDTLAQVTVSIRTGELECRPDEDAARLCAASLGARGNAVPA